MRQTILRTEQLSKTFEVGVRRKRVQAVKDLDLAVQDDRPGERAVGVAQYPDRVLVRGIAHVLLDQGMTAVALDERREEGLTMQQKCRILKNFPWCGGRYRAGQVITPSATVRKMFLRRGLAELIGEEVVAAKEEKAAAEVQTKRPGRPRKAVVA